MFYYNSFVFNLYHVHSIYNKGNILSYFLVNRHNVYQNVSFDAKNNMFCTEQS